MNWVSPIGPAPKILEIGAAPVVVVDRRDRRVRAGVTDATSVSQVPGVVDDRAASGSRGGPVEAHQLMGADRLGAPHEAGVWRPGRGRRRWRDGGGGMRARGRAAGVRDRNGDGEGPRGGVGVAARYVKAAALADRHRPRRAVAVAPGDRHGEVADWGVQVGVAEMRADAAERDRRGRREVVRARTQRRVGCVRREVDRLRARAAVLEPILVLPPEQQALRFGFRESEATSRVQEEVIL